MDARCSCFPTWLSHPDHESDARCSSRRSSGPGLSWLAASAALVVLNTDFVSPPRFDGAATPCSAMRWRQGVDTARSTSPIRHGTRIFRPAIPPHSPFSGDAPAARSPPLTLFSVLCTVSAVLLAWRWFGTIYPRRPAFILGPGAGRELVLGRSGGSIQSEPLYVLLQSTRRARRGQVEDRDTVGTGVLLGLALAACVLIRHVGLCFAAAVFLDLGSAQAVADVGPRRTGRGSPDPPLGRLALRTFGNNTQVGLLADKSLAGRIPGQAIFYVQRLPDQITGPFVEVATVFGRSARHRSARQSLGGRGDGIIIWGWISTLRTVPLAPSAPPTSGRSYRLDHTRTPVHLAVHRGRPTLCSRSCHFSLWVRARASLGPWRSLGSLRPRDWACGMVLAVSIPYSTYAVATGRAEAQRLLMLTSTLLASGSIRTPRSPVPSSTRHPGEVFWQTRRQAVAPAPPDPEAIDQLIRRFGVAYLLIDEDRFANESANPLSAYVKRYPGSVGLVWCGLGATLRSRSSRSIRRDELNK